MGYFLKEVGIKEQIGFFPINPFYKKLPDTPKVRLFLCLLVCVQITFDVSFGCFFKFIVHQLNFADLAVFG